MIGLDTNTLLRLVVADDPDQAALVRSAVRSAIEAGMRCHVNRIALVEFVWVMESVFKKSRAEIAHVLDRVLGTDGLVVENEAAARTALEAYRNGPVDFADAFIAMTNQALGCDVTLTFDRRAARLPEFQLLT